MNPIPHLHRELRRTDCKKLLVASKLHQALKDKLHDQNASLGIPPKDLISGQIRFMGVPVIESSDLKDDQYALVLNIPHTVSNSSNTPIPTQD